jgi:hypothetical protein
MGRLTRDPEAPVHYGNSDKDHRKATPWLLKESERRCAYSCQHESHAGKLEVDHFNPKLNAPLRNRHVNLLPASRHCNGSKWKHWPTKTQLRMGYRFLNPYTEVDYGKHLVEDPQTHLIEGTTPAGEWHLEKLDLNDPLLVAERKTRAEIWKTLNDPRELSAAAPFKSVRDSFKLLRDRAEAMMPPFPSEITDS